MCNALDDELEKQQRVIAESGQEWLAANQEMRGAWEQIGDLMGEDAQGMTPEPASPLTAPTEIASPPPA